MSGDGGEGVLRKRAAAAGRRALGVTAYSSESTKRTLEALADAVVEAVLAELGLQQVGWLGTVWDEADYLPKWEFDPEKTTEDERWFDAESEEADEAEVVIYDAGDWSLRHEDGADDLVRPIPLYACLTDYFAPSPALAAPDRETSNG